MESLYLLIPLSVAVVLMIGWIFWRALQSGQFDDLDRPGYDILSDDDTSGTSGQRAQAQDPEQHP